MNQNPSHPVVLATYRSTTRWPRGCGKAGSVRSICSRYTTTRCCTIPRRRSAAAGRRRAPVGELLHARRRLLVHRRSGEAGVSDAARTTICGRSRCSSSSTSRLMGFVFFMFSQWNLVLGMLAAYLYASDGIFYDLVSFAFYYYWDIPLTFVVLGALLLACRRPAEATAWLALAGAALGFGVWLRGSWWPLVAVSLRRRRLAAGVAEETRCRARPVCGHRAPLVIRSTRARGQLTFTTRAVWHVALVGLGYYPNPTASKPSDGTIFELTRQKYGVTFRVRGLLCCTIRRRRRNSCRSGRRTRHS